MFFYSVDDTIATNLKSFSSILIGEWGPKARSTSVSTLTDEAQIAIDFHLQNLSFVSQLSLSDMLVNIKSPYELSVAA